MPFKKFPACNEPNIYLDIVFEFSWIWNSKRSGRCITDDVLCIQGHGEGGGSRWEERIQGRADQNVNIAVGELLRDYAGRGDVFVEGGEERNIL